MVIGKIKKFDQKLYDKYDTPARNIIKNMLKEYVSDNPNIYGEDMILNIPDCRYKYLELQVCTNWLDEDKYPYDCPFVYARKANFDDKTLFLILNRNMTKGLIFNRKSLSPKPRRLKKFSRYFVYDVPWHCVMQLYMQDLTSDALKLYY